MSQEGVWGKEEGHSGPSLLGACLQASLGQGIFVNTGLVALSKAPHVTHQDGEGFRGLRGSVSHLRGGSGCWSSGEGRQGQWAGLHQKGKTSKAWGESSLSSSLLSPKL